MSERGSDWLDFNQFSFTMVVMWAVFRGAKDDCLVLLLLAQDQIECPAAANVGAV